MVNVDATVEGWLDGHTTPDPEPKLLLKDLFSGEASEKASALHYCSFEFCDRSIPGYGFRRPSECFRHMREIHDWQPARRPSSGSGTYTCTYHGCALRFETPSKLHKHKREAHRQTVSAGEGNALAMGTSHHKCERINPSTGKPCNSVFSRPYDLTRHEDVIHNNIRKQKVRCHICTEEKTFSRKIALTRHMRVVHPEVQRRKGREEQDLIMGGT
jgi:hypothetical protein